MLIFTLPVTVAAVETLFSKLKLIKDCRRNSMEQSRTNNFSTLAFESTEAKKIDFKNLKSRRKEFL